MSQTYWPRGLPRSLTVPRTSLWHNLDVTAARFPDKVAVWFYGRELTYRALQGEAARLSGHLQRAGVQKGDRVLVWLQNSPQFVVACHAVWRAGAVVVPLSPMLTPQELQFFMYDAGLKVGLVGAELYPKARAAALPHVVVASLGVDVLHSPVPTPDVFAVPEIADGDDVTWGQATSGAEGEVVEVASDDLAILPYTSGTTGRPKGVMHTHGTVQANIVAGSAWVSATSEEVILGTLPFFHVTGFVNSMMTSIFGGATHVVMTRWDREVARTLIRTKGVTLWTNTATMVIDLLASPNLSADDLRTLKNVTGGGAALPAAVGAKFEDLTGLRFIEGYGLTETMAQSHTNPADAPKLQCLGIPIFGTDARVLDLDSGRELPPGETGEIVISGPQVMTGYWNSEQATSEAFVELDGKRFFRSGDLGYRDEEGYFFFVDRLKRMVNVSGMKVWPAEVESILYHHPAVQEAVVIAAPDERTGEQVKALVVRRAGQDATPDAIQAWAREHMASYKIPRDIEFVESLPKGPTGKIAWRPLQEAERAKARA